MFYNFQKCKNKNPVARVWGRCLLRFPRHPGKFGGARPHSHPYKPPLTQNPVSAPDEVHILHKRLIMHVHAQYTCIQCVHVMCV